jgi:uncharacterized protein YlxP (DUF503 family)
VYVASVRVELHLPYSHSLKEKRAVLKSIKDRMRNTGAAVAEVDHLELWQRAALGMAVVAGEAEVLGGRLAALRDIVERQDEVQVLDWIEAHHE